MYSRVFWWRTEKTEAAAIASIVTIAMAARGQRQFFDL